MTEPQDREPERYEPRQYRRQYQEKGRDEKGHDEKGRDEKGRDESWDEKWRRDPIEAAMWAFALIWFGLVWFASNTGTWWRLLGEGAEWWSVGFLGAGVILLLGAVARVLMPAYRRPIAGSLILGIVFIGIGMGQLWDWVVIGPLVLVGIGVALLLTGVLRRRE